MVLRPDHRTGKPLLLPAPFDVTLPTDGFPVR